MKIPAETIPPVPNLGREISDERKTEPVSNLAGLASGLSASPQGRPLPTQPRPPGGSRVDSPPAVEEAGAPPVVERRKGERRSESRPVLLDTRTSKGRRQSPGDGRINIKV
jgi:hypothetical protein